MKAILYKSYAKYAQAKGISRNTKHRHAIQLETPEGKRAGYIDLFSML
jgi:hypothetical protein